MFLITIIPIARGISKENLTYLSPNKIKVGSLIDVPLRKKIIKALVLEVKDAKNQKMAIRSAGFSLRKVHDLNERPFLSPDMIQFVQNTSDYYATTIGAGLYGFLNKHILEEENIPTFKKTLGKKTTIKAIEGNFDFRLNNYEEVVEENLKKNKSTVIVCPTIDSAKKSFSFLRRDYEKISLLFHSQITKKAFQKNLVLLKSNKANVLLITGNFLAILPENTGTLIIEEENSRWYKMRNRPFFDFRKITKDFGDEFNINILLGDILLSTSSFEETNEFKRERNRNLKTLILDSNPKKDVEKQEYEPLGKEIEKEIESTLKKKEKGFCLEYKKRLCTYCALSSLWIYC